MTATIRPSPDATGVQRLDPALRLGDYERALSFYLDQLDNGIDTICFAENSHSDLGSLRALVAARGASDRVLFVEQREPLHPPAYGRCYGETMLLDEAMSALQAHGCPPDTIFWKVTGRYKVLNLARMLQSRPRGADLYIDMRSRFSQRWADLRLMSWTAPGYARALKGIAPSIREDTNEYRPGEEAAYDVLSERIKAADIDAVTSFRVEPLIDGIRAFDEKNWSAGRQRVVYYARNLQRAVLGRVLF